MEPTPTAPNAPQRATPRRRILVIGIGAGNPDHVTIQAVEAMNRADVFFVPDKGAEKQRLAGLRREILDRFVKGHARRTVAFDVPRRDATREYLDGVADWHAAVAAVYERLLAEELREAECGAFLVWGDPALYDSVIRILERVRANGRIEFDYEVIPGISAVQALAARHRVVLNDIGQSVLLTTGRRLAEGFPEDAGSVVVMLDGDNAWRSAPGDLDIYWGAYLGMPEEILVSGRLADVAADIERLRAEARAKNGWIMDTYLLKKPRGE